VIMHQLF